MIAAGSIWLGNRATLLFILILIMNVCDAYLTYAWMDLGVIEEANPLMAYLLEVSTSLFFAVKLTLVSLGGYLLWRHRWRWLAQLGLLALFCVYLWVMVLHINVARLVEKYGVL